jgi:hypothetical protein
VTILGEAFTVRVALCCLALALSFALHSRVVSLRCFHQSVPCLSESAGSRQGPLAPGSFEPFFATTSPSDSHFQQPLRYCLPRWLCSFTHRQSGSPKFLVPLSVRAARLYPGKSGRRFQLSFRPPVMASALLHSLATPIFVFRGFRRRFAFAAARTFAVPRLQRFGCPHTARSASCPITLYMASSFQLARSH